MKKLTKITTEQAWYQTEIAMNLHYLAEAILNYIPDDSGTGDIFGIGEDCFIRELYPYAQLIAELTDQADSKGHKFKGIFVYEAMEPLAELFMGIVDRQEAEECAAEMPDIDEFELDILRVIESH